MADPVVDRQRAQDADGESPTFEAFFRQVYPNLTKALLLLTGERTGAEDIAQEALARVYERWDRVRTMERPEGYVYRTALNLHRKGVRRALVRLRRSRPPDRPPDELERAEARTEVLAALAALSDGQREALVLVEWLGLTTEEAGRALGIRPVSVRGRLHRARETLRRRFGDG